MKAPKYKQLDILRINNHADIIIRNIKEESLATYCFLQKQWKSSSAVKNKLFQFVYRSFYRMDNAGLTDEFKERYFELMEINRNKKNIDLEEISEDLGRFKNLKKQDTLQFSFITKLASTIDTQFPIYDKKIATAYKFKNYYKKDVILRFPPLIDFYNFLKEDYETILNENKLVKSLATFDAEFFEYKDSISLVKKIDFILWSAGDLSAKTNLFKTR